MSRRQCISRKLAGFVISILATANTCALAQAWRSDCQFRQYSSSQGFPALADLVVGEYALALETDVYVEGGKIFISEEPINPSKSDNACYGRRTGTCVQNVSERCLFKHGREWCEKHEDVVAERYFKLLLKLYLIRRQQCDPLSDQIIAEYAQLLRRTSRSEEAGKLSNSELALGPKQRLIDLGLTPEIVMHKPTAKLPAQQARRIGRGCFWRPVVWKPEPTLPTYGTVRPDKTLLGLAPSMLRSPAVAPVRQVPTFFSSVDPTWVTRKFDAATQAYYEKLAQRIRKYWVPSRSCKDCVVLQFKVDNHGNAIDIKHEDLRGVLYIEALAQEEIRALKSATPLPRPSWKLTKNDWFAVRFKNQKIDATSFSVHKHESARLPQT